MHSKTFLITLVLFLLLVPSIVQITQSYEINPAKWVFYQKDDYELKPIFFNFEIKNTNTAANGTITISLKTISPEYLYSDQYPDIVAFPDYSWITIAETTVTVPPNSTVEVPVHVNIPEQYWSANSSSTAISNYNKTYEAWFLAHQTAGPGNIRVDYRCRWVFITPTKYVAPWQRPGALFPYPPEVLYAIILIVIILIVAIFILLRRRGGRGKKKEQQEEEPTTRGDDVWQQ